MANTIKELIEYLQTLPEDTEISVVSKEDCEEHPLDLDPIYGNVDFVNLEGNKFVENCSHLYNRKFLVFGEY